MLANPLVARLFLFPTCLHSSRIFVMQPWLICAFIFLFLPHSQRHNKPVCITKRFGENVNGFIKFRNCAKSQILKP